MLSVIRKRSFLSLSPGVESASDIIRAEGAIIRPIIRMAYRGGSAGTTRCSWMR